MEIAMSGSPALPSIRNPGPMTTGIASSSPPASASSLVALAVPRAPEGTPSGPQITELAQASPTGSTFSATVSALPAIPSQNQPKTVQSNAPLVSALAQAKPPTSGDLLAQTGLPLPEIAGLTPDVTRLASETPSIGETAPVAVSEVPAVPSSQTTAINAASAPAVAQSQPSPSSVPAAPLTPASSPTEAPSKAAPATAGQPTSAAPVQTVAPAMAKAGRIPVRPSAALAAASYYLQLGVYGESSAALALADNLSPDYPVSVYAFKSNDKSLYKVMIGPLNSDESGTLLYLFTAQGYRDAFVRKGD
jgi:hypothetical protein